MNKPKLRFKGYTDEWEEKKLGEVGNFLKGKGLSKKDIVDDGKYQCILYGELYTKYGEVINHVYSRTNCCGNVEISIGNEVLIPSSGESSEEIAQASYLPYKNILLGGDINIFRTIENGIYISYFLNQNAKRLSVIAQGATVVHLYANSLKNVKVTFPSLPEQEKIGSFLSKIDERIELEEKKLELFKERKCGWMQKLFNQEIRFKDEDGNDYPDWEEKKLGEILIETNNRSEKNNQFDLLSSTNSGLYRQNEYFNHQVASKDNIGYKIVKLKQIVLSPQNLWLGNINYNDKYSIGLVSPSYKVFDVSTQYNSTFISHLLRTNRAFYLYKTVSEQGASIVRRNLNMELFRDLTFYIPSLPEQEKIAEFLSKQDELISAQEKKVSLLKEQKKGLLQQMFV